MMEEYFATVGPSSPAHLHPETASGDCRDGQAACIVSTAIYAHLILFAPGILVALGRMDWRIALPLIVIADLVGDTGYYALGYWSRQPLFARIRQRLALVLPRLVARQVKGRTGER